MDNGLKLAKKEIKQLLSKHQRQKVAGVDSVRAAVLVPLFYRDEEYHLLFTRRSDKVTYHKGQVSFPGGAQAKDDSSLLDTALREAYEEIGLKAKDTEILGELDDTVSFSSGFVISPFVVLIPHPYPFKINSEEVAEIFDIPLSALLKRDNLRVEYQTLGERALPTYFYEYKGKVVWGATARIVIQLLELLFPGWKAPA